MAPDPLMAADQQEKRIKFLLPICTGCGGIIGYKLDGGCTCDPAVAKTGKGIEVMPVGEHAAVLAQAADRIRERLEVDVDHYCRKATSLHDNDLRALANGIADRFQAAIDDLCGDALDSKRCLSLADLSKDVEVVEAERDNAEALVRMLRRRSGPKAVEEALAAFGQALRNFAAKGSFAQRSFVGAAITAAQQDIERHASAVNPTDDTPTERTTNDH